MGLFGIFNTPSSYAAGGRLSGFPRYRELLSRYSPAFFKVNLLTVLGFIPLVIGFQAAIEKANLGMVLIVCALGGAIAGPFWAGLIDTIYRALRDAPGGWFDNYRRAWRQNWRAAILPGMISSTLMGGYGLVALLFYAGQIGGWGTLTLFVLSLLFFTIFFTVYWPLLVLIDQPNAIRVRNCLAFFLKAFWKLIGIGLLQLAYWLVMILFFPLTLLTVPILGFWFINFLVNFLIYDAVDKTFEIEAQIAAHFPDQVPQYDLR